MEAYSQFIVLFVVLIAGAVILCKPWFGILVYFCMAMLNPSVIWPELFSSYRLSLLVALITVAGVTYSVYRRGLELNNFHFYFPFTLLLICLFVNVSHFMSDIDPQFVYLSTLTPGDFLGYFNKLIFVYLLSLVCVTKWLHIKWLIGMLLCVVLVYSVWSNLSYLSDLSRNSSDIVRVGGSFSGFLKDENNLAALLVLGVAPAFYFMINQSRASHKIIMFLALITILHAIYLTGSRGGLIALGSVVIFIALRKNNRTHTAILLISFLITLPILGKPVLDRVVMTVESHDNSEEHLNPRISIWLMGYEILKESPWLGIGPSRFQTEVSKYPLRENSPVGSCGENTPCVAHNTLLQISTSGGVVAGALYMFLGIYMLFPVIYLRLKSALFPGYLRIRWNSGCLIKGKIKQTSFQKKGPVSVRKSRNGFCDYSGEIIRASVLGVFVCGFFLDLMLFDAFYLLIVLYVVRQSLIKRDKKRVARIRKEKSRRRKAFVSDSAVVVV